MQFQACIEETVASHPCILGARSEQHVFKKCRAQFAVFAKYGYQPLVDVLVIRSMPVQPLDPVPDAFWSDCRMGLKHCYRDAPNQPRDVPLRLGIGFLHQRACGFDETVQPRCEAFGIDVSK